MNRPDHSEYTVTPRLMLVHDPTPFGAFEQFGPIEDEAARSRTLFRERPDPIRLHEQHRTMVDALSRRVRVVDLCDVLGPSGVGRHRDALVRSPNLVFAHDALITIPWLPGLCLLAAMKEPVRRVETTVYADVAAELGLRELVRVPDGLFLEGGDVFPLAFDGTRRLLIGCGPRTSTGTPEFLRDTLVRDGMVDEIVAIEIAPWRLNLDGCCFPVSRSSLVANRDSILGGRRLTGSDTTNVDPLVYLADLGFTVIEASRHESFFLQACNFACLGDGVLLAYGMTERINDLLRSRGLEVLSFDGSELVKGNGGPHCLTRPVF